MHTHIADCHCNSDFSGHGIFIGRYHWLAGNPCAGSLSGRGSRDPYVERQVWKPDGNGISHKLLRELNSFALDSLRGLDETIQYDQGEKRKEQMSERSRSLAGMQEN